MKGTEVLAVCVDIERTTFDPLDGIDGVHHLEKIDLVRWFGQDEPASRYVLL